MVGVSVGVSAALVTFVLTWYLHLVLKYVAFYCGRINEVNYNLRMFFTQARGSRIMASILIGISIGLVTG